MSTFLFDCKILEAAILRTFEETNFLRISDLSMWFTNSIEFNWIINNCELLSLLFKIKCFKDFFQFFQDANAIPFHVQVNRFRNRQQSILDLFV